MSVTLCTLLTIRPYFAGTTKRGLDNSLETRLEAIRQNIASHFAQHAEIRIAGSLDSRQSRFYLDLNALHSGGKLRCSAVLRDGRSSHIYESWIETLDEQYAEERLRELADALCSRTHRGLVDAITKQPSLTIDHNSKPLGILMDEAAELLATGSDRHQHLAQGLREKLQRSPHDAMTAITLASCIHTALVLGGTANIEQDMTEMEGLLLPHLAGVQHHPIFLATAGKLLFFLGHHKLGDELANTALDEAPTQAAVLQIYAQIRMFSGDLEEALEYFDYASSNCEPGSKFHAAIQVMKSQAYRANGNMQQAAQLVNDIVARDAGVRLQMNFALLGDSEFIDEQSTAMAAVLNQEQWQAIISLIFHISARPFVSEALRDRAMNGVVSLAHKHIGSACLIGELEGSTPALCQRYR